MKKIKLEEFIRNFDIILSYSINHMIKEDWCEYTDSPLVSEIFETMDYFVEATQKCLEYREMLEEYKNADRKSRGCVFLDEK